MAFTIYLKAGKASFTTEQLADYREAFEVFDVNNDGKITIVALKRIMTQLGQEVTEAELKHIMDSVDKEKHGYIDFNNFCQIMHTCAPRSLEEQLRETFKLIDKDNSGKISSVELKQVLRRIGDNDITDDEIEDLIREIDLDGDGEVDYEEFVKIMVNK